ncbi:MAG: HlyD family efflux transporter periplasmic adaptor subunit [Rhizobiales bacterium]|nr:HlyD family efflux transporter periplasmic adaptor subunit [Hyphomicrobiales bacterium]
MIDLCKRFGHRTGLCPEPAPSGNDAPDRKAWQTVAPGRVEPWSGEIRIGSPGVGRIGDVLVTVNDTVFAGEALIRLDDDEVRNRHAKAELQYSLRKRARPSAQRRNAERRKHEDAVADAERAVVDERAAVDRAAAAKRAGTGSDDDLATARKNLSNAREQLRQRQAELASYEDDAPATTPTELDQQVAMARLDLRGAEAALDNLTIRAPIAGTVLQVNVRAGELASPSAPQPLVIIGDVSKLRIRAEIDERDYGAIKVGHRVIVRSPAFRDREVKGTVSSIAPIIGAGRIGARGQRNLTDVNVAEALIDLAEPGPLAVGMKVDVYFSREAAQR